MALIKVCGIRSVAQARACVDEGVDLVGLNFVPGRRRAIDISSAIQIAEASIGVQRVGVFVDASIEDIRALADQVPLEWIQLHGREPPSVCAALATHHKIIKAIGVHDELRFDAYEAFAPHVHAFLLDAPRPGSGRTFDWDLVSQFPRTRPLFVAGGLHADNVGAAIAAAHPDGVDTASGVEVDGQPDPKRIAEFCRAVRSQPS